MRILVTRPLEDANRIAGQLRARGHEPLVAPLMEIRFREGPEISLDGIQAVLATSANGVRALAKRSARRDVPVLAVGPQTAAEAQALGFIDVRDAQGDGAALALAVEKWAEPANGALLHVAGREASAQLARKLTDRDFEVRTAVLYDALPVESLPEQVVKALQNGALDAAMFFSPRSAQVFVDCIGKAGLGAGCARLTAFCISQAAAARLAPLTFGALRVAKNPNQEALLALLD
jgi:uroporphyrinogen-III synthase